MLTLPKIRIVIHREKIKEYAAKAGFDLCGVARVRSLDEQKAWFGEWLTGGYHGDMEYMRRNIDRRFDPAQLIEGARTVICCAVSYNHGLHRQVEALAAAGVPRIASYAFAPDYHTVIKGMLGQLFEALHRDDPAVEGRCFVDTAPLLEKAWAVEAGLGWSGRNSLLITPGFGSFVLLGEIVTTAGADSYDRPYTEDGCGACRRCEAGCPSGALHRPHMIDGRRCISRLTVERIAGGGTDAARLHGWVFGCDACQTVCPYNRHPQPGRYEGLRPIVDPAELTAEFWLDMSEGEFAERFGHTPLTRCGLARIQERIRQNQ